MLILIQIGGLGFIAIAMSFSKLVRSKMSLYQRTLISESIGALKYGGLNTIMRQMILGTFIIETLGAAIIAVRLSGSMPIGKALWFGIFHNISESVLSSTFFDLLTHLPWRRKEKQPNEAQNALCGRLEAGFGAGNIKPLPTSGMRLQ